MSAGVGKPWAGLWDKRLRGRGVNATITARSPDITQCSVVCFSHCAQNNPDNAYPGVIWKWPQILAGNLISCVVRNNFKSPPESLKVQAMTDHSGGGRSHPLYVILTTWWCIMVNSGSMKCSFVNIESYSLKQGESEYYLWLEKCIFLFPLNSLFLHPYPPSVVLTTAGLCGELLIQNVCKWTLHVEVMNGTA